MINPPKTLEDAESYTYGHLSFRKKFHHSRCAYGVWTKGRGAIEYQCTRKPGHGPARLYCVQHAEMVEPTKPKEERPRKLSPFEVVVGNWKKAQARAESLEAAIKSIGQRLESLVSTSPRPGPGITEYVEGCRYGYECALDEYKQALGESGVGA